MTWKAVRQFFAEHYDRRRDGRGVRRSSGIKNETGSAASTWIQAPLFSLHRQQIRAHLLLGIWDTLVMGSIFSGLPMLTCTERKELVLNVHTSPVKTSAGAMNTNGFQSFSKAHKDLLKNK